MTDKIIYRRLRNCLIAGSLLLTGCSEKTDEAQLAVEYSGVELQAVTRTDGAYSIPSAVYNSSPDIHLFLTTANPSEKQEGVFQFDSFEKRWKSSDIKVKEEAQYYMYGYMPDVIGGSTLTVPEGEGMTYADGASLSLTGLPAITSQDVCVIVGVQKVSTTTLTQTPNVTEGSYGYFSGIKGENYVNLLMDHLYSSIELSFKIDADYAQLRSLYLKTVTLKSSFGTVNANLTLWDGQGIGTPTFTGNDDDANHTVAFLAATTLEAQKVLDKNYISSALTLDALAYCAPCIFGADATHLTLTTVYDVYDKDNNNLGERTSVNAINIAAIPSGQKRKLTLTVNPSYLYILSNWDIDNPELVIEQ